MLKRKVFADTFLFSFFLFSSCLFSILISGCSTYTCERPETGIQCTPISEIYERVVEKGERPGKWNTHKDSDKSKQELKQKTPITSPSGSSGFSTVLEKDKPLDESMKDKTMLLRIPSKIIRIWVAPWEDNEGDLNQGGYIYSEIAPPGKKWLVGEKPIDKQEKARMRFFQPRYGLRQKQTIDKSSLPQIAPDTEIIDKAETTKTRPPIIYSVAPEKPGVDGKGNNQPSKNVVSSEDTALRNTQDTKVTIDKKTLEKTLLPKTLPIVEKPITETKPIVQQNIEKSNINRQDTEDSKDIKQQASKCEEGICQIEH